MIARLDTHARAWFLFSKASVSKRWRKTRKFSRFLVGRAARARVHFWKSKIQQHFISVGCHVWRDCDGFFPVIAQKIWFFTICSFQYCATHSWNVYFIVTNRIWVSKVKIRRTWREKRARHAQILKRVCKIQRSCVFTKCARHSLFSFYRSRQTSDYQNLCAKNRGMRASMF